MSVATCPPAYDVVATRAHSPEDRAAALGGDFDVLLGYRANLAPPVDWGADPYESRSWRHWLHALGWLDVLFQIHRDGDPSGDAALAQARDLALDWIAANPLPAPAEFQPAWADKVTADRTGYIAYLSRAAACEGLLDDAQAATLIDSLRLHAQYLTEYHTVRDDHGLYGDYALGLLGGYMPFLPEAADWHALAVKRFEPTLRRRYVDSERIWLANSPNYQATVAKLAGQFADDVQRGPRLARITRRLASGLGWFVLPDGGLAPFGDLHTMDPLPGWIGHFGAAARGFRVLPRSGYAFVKRGSSYLGASASFRSANHKHADDLTFELFEAGRRVVTDSGFYDYDYSKRWNRFQRSPQAHSVLTVDGEGFRTGYGDEYGSGILAGGRGAGWYAVLGVNPTVRRQGVRHLRLYLFKPGVALAVVDLLRSRERHVYRRYLQFAPQLDVTRAGRRLRLSAPRFAGSVASSGGRPELVRGDVKAPAGWSFADYREREPRWTASYRTRAADAEYVTTIGLDKNPPRVRVLSASAKRFRIRVQGSGRVLEVMRRGERLALSPAGR